MCVPVVESKRKPTLETIESYMSSLRSIVVSDALRYPQFVATATEIVSSLASDGWLLLFVFDNSAASVFLPVLCLCRLTLAVVAPPTTSVHFSATSWGDCHWWMWHRPQCLLLRLPLVVLAPPTTTIHLSTNCYYNCHWWMWHRPQRLLLRLPLVVLAPPTTTMHLSTNCYYNCHWWMWHRPQRLLLRLSLVVLAPPTTTIHLSTNCYYNCHWWLWHRPQCLFTSPTPVATTVIDGCGTAHNVCSLLQAHLSSSTAFTLLCLVMIIVATGVGVTFWCGLVYCSPFHGTWHAHDTDLIWTWHWHHMSLSGVWFKMSDTESSVSQFAVLVLWLGLIVEKCFNCLRTEA